MALFHLSGRRNIGTWATVFSAQNLYNAGTSNVSTSKIISLGDANHVIAELIHTRVDATSLVVTAYTSSDLTNWAAEPDVTAASVAPDFTMVARTFVYATAASGVYRLSMPISADFLRFTVTAAAADTSNGDLLTMRVRASRL